MFHEWHWEADTFARATQKQLDALAACNATLFQRPELLRRLPTNELFNYLANCFKGEARRY
eukprot:7152716-Prymnesium_polylepis.1